MIDDKTAGIIHESYRNFHEMVTTAREDFRKRTFGKFLEPVSFTCPKCGRTSYNPNDITNEYCGHCHEFIEVKNATAGN